MAKSAPRLRAAIASVPTVFCDGLGFAGAGLAAYGAWLIYPPAGFIVGGVLLIAGAALFGARLNAGPT